MDVERLARMEAKIDALTQDMSDFIRSQEKHNDSFYEVRDSVRDMKANARGAWFTIGLFGTLTVAVSGLVSWVVSNIRQ